MDIIWPNYEIIVSDIEEIIPHGLDNSSAPAYLAELKAEDLINKLPDNYLLITADTVVIHEDTILGKPKDKDEAISMVTRLSGGDHDVISGVCIRTEYQHETFSDLTKVTLAQMSAEEISFYVDQYEVMDKAGSYGIQDWLGVSKVTRLKGSYYNVMGLPVHLLYEKLSSLL